MKSVQMQTRKESNIDAKLDKIAYLLEELIKIHEAELYPVCCHILFLHLG